MTILFGSARAVWDKCNGRITSHVFLTVKYNKGISPVGLLLLIGVLMRMRVSDDADLGPS